MVREWEDGIQVLFEILDGPPHDWEVVALLKRQLMDGPVQYTVHGEAGDQNDKPFELNPHEYDHMWTEEPQTLATTLRWHIGSLEYTSSLDKRHAEAEVTMILKAERYL